MYGILGFLVANFFRAPSQETADSTVQMGVRASLLLAFPLVMEICQVYTHPLIGNATVMMVACVGMLLGWFAYSTRALQARDYRTIEMGG
jgi:hypothetical protein